jgi:hypothetical protein
MNFQPQNLPVRFGRGAVALRNRDNTPLTIDQIRAYTPAVVAEDKHSSRSDKYTYISTVDAVQALQREGFEPYSIQQGGSKDEEKRAFTKHLIRFRHRSNNKLVLNETFYEACLFNAHDGTGGFKAFGGFFRLACLNGLIVSAGEAEGISIPHRGDVLHKVIEASYRVIENGQQAVARLGDFTGTQLSTGEQRAFASAAAELRFDDTSPVRPEALLVPRRAADTGNDLWRTFNRVQENVIRGGVGYTAENAQGRVTHRSTRPVRAVDGDVKLNRALWVLADELAKLKAA